MEKIFWIILLSVLATSKGRQPENNTVSTVQTAKYATGFRTENKGSYLDVYVQQSNDSNEVPLRYRLVKNKAIHQPEADVTIIQVPISTIVCTSTTHIPHLDYLGESDKLIGFPSTQYISSAKVRKRIDKGFVKELGVDNSLNLELLAQLQPTMVMTYTMSKDMGHLKKVQELGIPVVVNAEYLEQHPLGRAEWIKFTALFFGKEKMADSVFGAIEKEYLMANSQAKNFSKKPTVLTGIPYGGIWYLPGGRNYAARFFEDAGCRYLWDNNPSAGFLQLSLETVYERASNADYWIGVGSFETYSDIKATDERFADFTAWKNKQVYNYNGRMGPTGGNEYMELGYLRPDLILKDLIQITHPDQYPKSDLFFYKAIK